jgi:hypothetical protein
MRNVIELPRQRDFGIGRQLDFPRSISMVGDRDAPNLSVVLRRNGHVQCRCKGAIAADDFGVIFFE